MGQNIPKHLWKIYMADCPVYLHVFEKMLFISGLHYEKLPEKNIYLITIKKHKENIKMKILKELTINKCKGNFEFLCIKWDYIEHKRRLMKGYLR